jgi:hypothetical protein
VLLLPSKALSTSETTRTVNKCAPSIFVACLRAEKGRVEDIQRTAIFNFRCQSRWAAENVGGFLKKVVAGIPRFLYRLRKIILLVVVVALVMLVFSFLIASWFNNGASNNGNNGANANDEINDQTIPTKGTLYVSGLDIYGGDTESESGNVYIDWGELTLGASKNASFYVRSNSNVDVELELNVANWTPAGIEDFIGISWDYNGTLLSPSSESLLVTVSLDVSLSGEFIDFIVDNGVTSFGFDMTVFASGV